MCVSQSRKKYSTATPDKTRQDNATKVKKKLLDNPQQQHHHHQNEKKNKNEKIVHFLCKNKMPFFSNLHVFFSFNFLVFA